MSIEDNKRVVRRFFEEVWNRNDVSKLDEILSSENKHYFGANLGRVGPNEARAIIENWRRGLPDFQYHVEDMIAEGDRVVSRVRFTGTHAGNFEMAEAGHTAVPMPAASLVHDRLVGMVARGWARNRAPKCSERPATTRRAPPD